MAADALVPGEELAVNLGHTLSAARSRPAGRSARRIKWRSQVPAYLFLLPALVSFAIFTWYPIGVAIKYSFQQVSLAGQTRWVGLANYQRMLADPLFAKAWRNTLEFTAISLAIGFLLPVVLALMINEMRRLSGLFRLIYYLPTLIPITVALLVWRQIYAPEGGILNSLLIQAGLEPQLWLQDPRLVKFSLIAILTWAGAGASLLIYLAALQEVPREIFEAAELDGFSPWQRARYIAIPSLASRMQVMLVLQVIFVVQIFAEPFLLTQGGPANTTLTPVLQSYRAAFALNDYGLASAWSVSLLVMLSLFSMVAVRLSNRNG